MPFDPNKSPGVMAIDSVGSEVRPSRTLCVCDVLLTTFGSTSVSQCAPAGAWFVCVSTWSKKTSVCETISLGRKPGLNAAARTARV